MPKDKIKETKHVDENGKKYYTIEAPPEDLAEESRFYCSAAGLRFMDADPITEEEKRRAAELWDKMAQPGTSPGKKEKKDRPGETR